MQNESVIVLVPVRKKNPEGQIKPIKNIFLLQVELIDYNKLSSVK